MAAELAELAAVEGIGPVIADSVVEFLASPANQHVIDKLRAAGVALVEPGGPLAPGRPGLPVSGVGTGAGRRRRPGRPVGAAPRPSQGRSVVVTGTIEGLHPGGGRGGHPGPGRQVAGERLGPDLGRGARAPSPARPSSRRPRSWAYPIVDGSRFQELLDSGEIPGTLTPRPTRSPAGGGRPPVGARPSVAWARTMSTITESIGRVLAGRYRIESALGSGASANVFAAFDTTLQRRVAVKVLHPALAADGGFLRRFRAEAQSAAALANAHVLAVHDWGEDAQGPFLVLEFLGGGSLRDMLDEGTRLSLSQAVAVGAQAAEGLAYAHARGFVHRDVKPANLLFDEEGRLRVADFGLARALAEASLTEPAGTTVGTARYAAPEQALGHRVDGRADVYSLALVLYEAVTGVVPFTADTTISTLMARVGAELPGHDGLGPLAEVLSEAATPEAEDRLDATAFAARLRELAEQLPAPEKLRLAGAGGAGVVLPRPVTPPPDRDLTEHGMVMPPPTDGTSQLTGWGRSRRPGLRHRGRHHRGRPRRSGGAAAGGRGSPPSWCCVVALVGAGAIVALMKTKSSSPPVTSCRPSSASR